MEQRFPTLTETVPSDRGPNDLNPYDLVIFQSARGGSSWDLYKITGSNPTPVPLVASEYNELRPRFRPNSDEIVFTRVIGPTQADLFTLDLTTGAEFRLTHGGINTQPSWSPDGAWIYFTSNRAGAYQIFRVARDGGAVTQITQGNPSLAPAVSPDGTKLAWVRVISNTHGQLVTANSDGGGETAAMIPYPYMQNPTWSPDGAYIAFDADINGDQWNDIGRHSVASGGGTPILQSAQPFHDLWMGGWDQRAPDVIYYADVTYVVENSSLVIQQAQLFRSLTNGGYNTPFVTGAIDISPAVGSLDNSIPSVSLAPLTPLNPSNAVALKWSAQDDGPAPITLYEVQAFRFASDPNWRTVATTTDSAFTFRVGEIGEEIQFRVRAIDGANNRSAWSGVAGTRLYSTVLDAEVTDARGIPYVYEPVTHNLAPAAIFAEEQGAGRTRLYQSARDSSELRVQAPPSTGPAVVTVNAHFPSFVSVYTHEDQNLIQNGGFENEFTAWTPGSAAGVYSVENSGHTGSHSAYLGADCGGCWAPVQSFGNVAAWRESVMFASGQDAAGTLHLVYVDLTGKLYYRQQPRSGAWSGATQVGASDYQSSGPRFPRISAVVDSGGRLHVVHPSGGNLVHRVRQANGVWNAPILLLSGYASNTDGNALTADRAGNVYHVGHQYDAGGAANDRYRILFRRLGQTGAWSSPEVLYRAGDDTLSWTRAAAMPDGTVHVLYTAAGTNGTADHPRHKLRLASGAWVELPRPFGGYPRTDHRYHTEQLLVDADGSLHAIFGLHRDDDFPEWEFFYSRWKGGSSGWTVPEALSLVDPYYQISWAALFVGADDALHVYVLPFHNKRHDLILRRHDDETWQQASIVPEESLWFWAIYPYYDPVEGYSFIGHGQDESGYTVEYTRWQTAVAPTRHTLSQPVTIPQSMPLPTLAFFYEFQRTLPAATTALEVNVSDGASTTPVFSDSAAHTGWQRQWVDLSAWAGETVTVTFALEQAAGEPLPLLRLDDVSLSSYLRPVLESVSPSEIEQDWDGRVVTVTGSNFLPPLTARADDVSVEVTRLDDNTLAVTLTEAIRPGRVALTITNGHNRSATIDTLWLGSRLYLPAVRR